MSDNNSQNPTRLQYLDMLRTIGIILMVMGHIGFSGVFSKWIHGFHIPLFYILSGYFYKNQPIKRLLKKRLRTIIIPYVIFGIFHCILDCIINK